MKTSLLQRVVCLLMIYVLLVPQSWATCGGGGGGGMGGMGMMGHRGESGGTGASLAVPPPLEYDLAEDDVDDDW